MNKKERIKYLNSLPLIAFNKELTEEEELELALNNTVTLVEYLDSKYYTVPHVAVVEWGIVTVMKNGFNHTLPNHVSFDIVPWDLAKEIKYF